MNTFFKRANKNKKKPFLKSEKIFKKSFISVFDSHRQEKRQKKNVVSPNFLNLSLDIERHWKPIIRNMFDELFIVLN